MDPLARLNFNLDMDKSDPFFHNYSMVTGSILPTRPNRVATFQAMKRHIERLRNV